MANVNFKVTYTRQGDQSDFTVMNVYPDTANNIRNPPKEEEGSTPWNIRWAFNELARKLIKNFKYSPLEQDMERTVNKMKKFGFEIVSIEEMKGRRVKINRRKR